MMYHKAPKSILKIQISQLALLWQMLIFFLKSLKFEESNWPSETKHTWWTGVFLRNQPDIRFCCVLVHFLFYFYFFQHKLYQTNLLNSFLEGQKLYQEWWKYLILKDQIGICALHRSQFNCYIEFLNNLVLHTCTKMDTKSRDRKSVV